MGEVIRLRQYGKGGWQETRGEIYRAIMQGVEFESGALHGVKFTPGDGVPRWTGNLPTEWIRELESVNPDYVVYSYRTPIAWHYVSDDDGYEGVDRWIIPDVYYSRTTSRHQGLARSALVFHHAGYQDTPLQ